MLKFKYLGSLFVANGLQCYDIDKRIVTAKSRYGKLCKMFDSKYIIMKLKIRLYVTSAAHS